MHWIARHILKRLAFSDSLRYNELKPDSVEGNLFQYYARSLEKQGLIERDEAGYRLTAHGKIFVADLSQTKIMHPRKLPRPVVMLVCKNDQGEHLFFRWKRQPYRGLVSLPFGRHIAGQPLLAMSEEQLYLKAGLTGDLAYLGHADIISQSDHLAVSIVEVTQPKQVSQPDGLTGEAFWSRVDQLDHADLLPGLLDVIAWTEDPYRSPLLEIYIDPT